MREHKTVHTGELPYVCSYCPNKYRLRRSLEVHVRGHTGEKPLQCKYCELNFKNNPEMRYHLNTKHKHDILWNQMSGVSENYEKTAARGELQGTESIIDDYRTDFIMNKDGDKFRDTDDIENVQFHDVEFLDDEFPDSFADD